MGTFLPSTYLLSLDTGYDRIWILRSPAYDIYTQCVSVTWHAAQTGVRESYRHTGGRKKWPGTGKGAVRFLAQMKETWQRNIINKVMPSANYEIPGVRQTDSRYTDR